jgi:hypothetical protein
VARRRLVLAGPLVALVAVAGVIDHRVGPAPWSTDFPRPVDGPVNQARREALARIDPAAPVSAPYNLVAHLAHRTRVYEFPNPFAPANWGFPGDQHQPAAVERVRYVLVERALLGEGESAVLDQLRVQPQWRTLLDQQGIVLLERVAVSTSRPVRPGQRPTLMLATCADSIRGKHAACSPLDRRADTRVDSAAAATAMPARGAMDTRSVDSDQQRVTQQMALTFFWS